MFAYYKFSDNIPYYIYEAYRLAEIKNIAIKMSNGGMDLYEAEKNVIQNATNYFTDGYLKNLKQNQISLKGSFSDREHYRRYEIGDVCEMPTPNNIKNFIGWYSTFDGKMYQPQEFAPMHISTHFIAMYSK
ncbi:MAG: hypothetical protein J6Q51_04880 [Clostridia bacterium]|nr:hypothetical protein [Clostridia bacterium]